MAGHTDPRSVARRLATLISQDYGNNVKLHETSDSEDYTIER